MDESFARGYCQLRSDTPTVERRTDQHSGFGSLNLGPPRDSCSLIYLSLILCGMGFLLPYNSFITAVDYYQAKYPNSTIIFDMSLTYISVAFIGVVLNNIFIELFSSNARITFGYVISVVMLLVISLTDVWFEIFPRDLSYKMNLVAVATVALGCTVQQSSFYGFTSMLPQRYTQAVMTGESTAGLMVSINRILTKALLDNPRVNTIIFFGVSIATVLFCCILFQVLRRTEFVRYFIGVCESAGLAEDQRGITSQAVANPEEVDILDGNVTRDNYGVLVIQSPTTPTDERVFPPIMTSQPEVDAHGGSGVSVTMTTRQNEVQVRGGGAGTGMVGTGGGLQLGSRGTAAYRKHMPFVVALKRGCWMRYQAAHTVWPYMISIGMAYLVTLCLFPGIESEIVSCRLHSWMPILLIAIFNLFDFIGKIIASVPFDWPPGALVLCSICRVLLVPLLMLCAAPRTDPVLSGEAWSMLISLTLGITNGYFGSVPMILASTKVPDEQKEITGNIMTLSYSIGLTSGSAIAYLLDAWLGPHPDVDICSAAAHNITIGYNTTSLLKALGSEMTSLEMAGL